MTQELEVKAAPQRIEVIDPIPILDTGRFEQIQRIASIMARSSLTPGHLRETAVVDDDGNKVYERGKALVEALPYDAIFANCFLIVNQALRWGIDPFVTASCTSVVAGRLCYEGKLVAGVLDAKMGIELSYEWNALKGDAFGITVSGRTQKRGELKSISGTVGEWKTTRKGSPWERVANHRRMLVYRGNREWARIYKPALMLGVYTEDEIDALEIRRSITPVQHALGRPPVGHDVAMFDTPAGRKGLGTHGSPELDADAEKLEAMGQDAGPTLEAIQRVTGVSITNDGTETTAVTHVEDYSEEAGPVDENPMLSSGSTSETQSTPTSGDVSGEEKTSASLMNASPGNGSPSGTVDGPTVEASTVPQAPTDAAGYEPYWIKCLAICEGRQDAAAEWAAQRKLRTKLSVPMDVVERCKAMVDEQFPKE